MSKFDRYRDLLIRLFPKGKLWQFNEGTENYKLLDAFGMELSRVDDRAEKLLKEQDPRTTIELLPEWEKEFGLPDECSVIGQDIAERRTNLVSKVLAQGGQSEAYFIDLFANQGITITISYREPSYVPMSIPGYVTGNAYKYIWYVTIPDFQVDWFEAGDSADDYVGEYLSSSNVACLIEKYKPAHTKAVYIYGS